MEHPQINAYYRKEESIKCIHTANKSLLTLHLLVSTKTILDRDQAWRFSQTGPNTHWTWSRKQGPTHIGPDLDPNSLILKVFLIFFVIFLQKVTLKKIRRRHFWKVIQIYPACKDLFFLSWFLIFVILRSAIIYTFKSWTLQRLLAFCQFRHFIYLEMLMEDGLDPYWPITLST